MAGDRPGGFMPLNVILDGGPAPSVASEVAGGIGKIGDDALAVALDGEIPFLVETAPVVTGRARRAEFPQVTAVRRKEPGSIGILTLRQRPFVGNFPAASRRRQRSNGNRSGRAIGRDDIGAGIVNAIGDKYLVAYMEVVADRPSGRDSVLIVAEYIFRAEQDAAWPLLDRNDPPRFVLADDVGKVYRQQARAAETQCPSARNRAARSRHWGGLLRAADIKSNVDP